MNLIECYGACKVSDFKVKNASQKWSQTSLKSILALHTMTKLTENSNMTFGTCPGQQIQIFWWFMNLIGRQKASKASDFKVKIALQKWSQTSPKLILAFHNMKKWTKNIIMAFCYLPRSTDTIFLVVYDPNRALEGLQGVGFQGKNCFTKLVSNFTETDFGFF